jgi:hypothetical protein
MVKAGPKAPAVTTVGAMTAPPAAPAGGAERNAGLRILWIVNKEVMERIERGELRFRSEYEAMRALLVTDTTRVLEVKVGNAVAYIVAFLEDDEYRAASSQEEAIRIAVEDPEGVTLVAREEIERLVKKAAGRE